MECDNFEIVRNIKAFKALQGDWEDLCGRSSQYRFSQSFTWCWATWEAVHKPQRFRGLQLHCVIARNGSRLVLVWPFVVYRRPAMFVATPLGLFNEYPDPLVEDGPEASLRIEAAWRTLRDTCACDVIRFRCVRQGLELDRLRESKKIGKRTRLKRKLAHWKVDWHNHKKWEDYYHWLSNKDRRDTERRRRRLEEQGGLTFEVIEGEECTTAIDWILANKLKQLMLAGRRGPFWLETKAYRNLLVLVATRGGPLGRIVVFALKLKGQIIAALLCRVDQAHVEAVITVYDEAYGRYAPGKILFIESLRWAFEHQLEFDFRGGNSRYKILLANRKSVIIDYDVAISRSYALGLRFPVIRPLIRSYRAVRHKLGKRFRGGWLKRAVSARTMSSDMKSLPGQGYF